jgi:transposase
MEIELYSASSAAGSDRLNHVWTSGNRGGRGLTPKQYQSGEIDRSGRISKCGDTLARTLMYEAAVVLMTRVKRPCGLKEWAQAIARRSGAGKARVALASKLSVIMHSIWRSGEPYRWPTHPAAT